MYHLNRKTLASLPWSTPKVSRKMFIFLLYLVRKDVFLYRPLKCQAIFPQIICRFVNPANTNKLSFFHHKTISTTKRKSTCLVNSFKHFIYRSESVVDCYFKNVFKNRQDSDPSIISGVDIGGPFYNQEWLNPPPIFRESFWWSVSIM